MVNVVKLEYPEPFIAEITMEDREARNTFSSGIISGLNQAFHSLLPETKIVIIHGYDNYFCCGGTQEELLDIYHGKMTFADLNFYRLLLDCEVPTIAAMNGHAIGGGLVFGCYADFIIMAEESVYCTNFMKYGFTPGLGATYIIPHKLGHVLANEMFFSARNYHGSELKEKNSQTIIVKKQSVLSTAFSLAKEIIDKPLISLKLLKQHQTQMIKATLPAAIEQELAMHAISFKLPEVEERIKTLFNRHS